MSILDITNLTDNPKKWIADKFKDAFEEVEKESTVNFTESEVYDFIQSEIENLEQQADETLGKNLPNLIDNYLVNLDYYAVVREYLDYKLESNNN